MNELVHADTAPTEKVDPDQAKVVDTEVTTEQKDMVSREDMAKALDDMHKYKRLAKEMEDKLKNREVDELKEKQEWQKIAQIKEAEAEDFRTKSEKLRDSIVWEKKYSALKDQAMKAGIRSEAVSDLELLDFEDLAVETTSTGRINVLGAEHAITKLKNTKPHWFGSKGVNINSSSPEVKQGGASISVKDIYAAEKKAKESGDYAPYYKIMKLYQQQN